MPTVTTGTYDGSTAISFTWDHSGPTFTTTLEFTSDKRMRARLSSDSWSYNPSYPSSYGYTYTVYARNTSGSYSTTMVTWNGSTEGSTNPPTRDGSYISVEDHVYNGYIYIGATCTAPNCNEGLSSTIQAIFQIEYDEPKNFVYIYNTSDGTWNTYTPYIYTSSGWTEYEPYIYTSSGWTEY